ncbi:MAG: tetratricopeptide repeat protein [Myxococcota bacterium]
MHERPPDGPAPDACRALIVERGAAGRAIARHLRERGIAPLVVDAPAEARHALAWASPEIAIVAVGRGGDAWTLLGELRAAGSRIFALGPRRLSTELRHRADREGVEALVAGSEPADRIAALVLDGPPGDAAPSPEDDGAPRTRAEPRPPALVMEERARRGEPPEGDLEIGPLDPDLDPLAAGTGQDPLEPDTLGSVPAAGDDDEPDTRVDDPPSGELTAPDTRAVIAAGLGGERKRQRFLATGLAMVATIALGFAGYRVVTGAPSQEAAGGLFALEEPAEPPEEKDEGAGAAPTSPEEEDEPKPEAEPEAVPIPTTTEKVNLLNFGEGVLEHRQGEGLKAARSYRYVLRNEGYHPGALAGLADALIRRGQLEDARPLLGRLVKVRPEDPEAQLGLGLVSASLGDRDIARRALERFLALAPDDPRRRDVRRLLADLPGVKH